ncbi:GNAT family N-acetyltransferase [Rhizobium sp. AC44/96]|uniref:GNAT family N-acetyltransferase n=1 Tax=Rhizobium sp. AC44/96 TaxID=1841654 RepID=UPI0009F221B9|nr:GNAT family N-acetyltransferase [Rhizobium sp. AC44/96]
MSETQADGLSLRPARPDELSRLADIEIDAFAALADALGVARDANALPQGVLGQSREEGLLFVAANEADRPIGFLAGTEIGETFYVIELDVVMQWQRRGVGRRLMLEAVKAARVRKLNGVTLTTDRYVVFNAPFYRSLGFELLGDERMPPYLRQKLDDEIENGMDPDRRVAMALWFK